jgi:hypothetical protein
MDFSELNRLPLGDALHAVASEGGATAVGFIGGGGIGRRFQSMIKADADVVTTMDGIKAWAGNNVPKLIAWKILRGRPLLGASTEDVNKGIATSVAFDTIARVLNKGKNPATATVFGYEVLGEKAMTESAANSADVNALIQENTAMRAKLAEMTSAAGVLHPDDRTRKFAFMPGTGSVGTPGAPAAPGVQKRQKRYGFAGESPTSGVASKPGAAYVQVGHMFNMH